MYNISNTFDIGDQVSWFNSRDNDEIQGIVISKGHSHVSIKLPNGERWAVAYCAINPRNLNPTIPTNNHAKLTKNDFTVGEDVEFVSNGKHFSGSIIKLNFKTATIKLKDQSGKWRVSYGLLTKLIDSTARTIVGELLYPTD